MTSFDSLTQKIKTFLPPVVFVVVAIGSGLLVGSHGPGVTALVGLGLFGIAWLVSGAPYWWLPLPLATFMGGVFQYDFKVYAFELGLLIAIATLLPGLPMQWWKISQRRGRPPFFVMLLGCYLLLHFFGSYSYLRFGGTQGLGSVIRVYVNAMWPLVFIIFFNSFGKSSQLKLGVIAMYVGVLLRLGIGLFVHFTAAELVIPVLNYYPAASFSAITGYAVQDLRHSGLALAGISLACLPLAQVPIKRFFHLAMFALGTLSISLGGGRTAIVLWAFYPIIFLIVFRRVVLLTICGVALAGAVALVNATPEVLDSLPMPAQRALGILVIERGKTLGQDLGAQSDIFHERFNREGYLRWTQNLGTVFFGSGVQPPDEDLDYADQLQNFTVWLERMTKNAANVGAYETTLWTVLAVTGLVGATCFLLLLGWLGYGAFRDLKINRISSPRQAVAYLGITQLTITLLFCWTSGGFPSMDIFLLYLAYIARLDDERAAEPTLAAEPALEKWRAPQAAVAAAPPRVFR